jgi:hypothetical protein
VFLRKIFACKKILIHGMIRKRIYILKKATKILSQMRVVDTKRFLDKVCYLDQAMFEKTRKAAKDFL